ncbi:MAG TPA: hypothetical protein VGG56_10200 [Terracidiphilus sp.]|jgi:hypothetical protein
MAVVINDLEIVLDPPQQQPGTQGAVPVPQKFQLTPQDFLAVMDRERRNRLRLQAH